MRSPGAGARGAFDWRVWPLILSWSLDAGTRGWGVDWPLHLRGSPGIWWLCAGARVRVAPLLVRWSLCTGARGRRELLQWAYWSSGAITLSA